MLSFSSSIIVFIQIFGLAFLFFSLDKWISFSISIFLMSMALIFFTNDMNPGNQNNDAFAQTKNSSLWIFPYSRSRTYAVRLISTFIVFFLFIVLVMAILSIGGAGSYYHFDPIVFGLMIIPCASVSLMCSSISTVNSSPYRKGFYSSVLKIFLLNIINIFVTYVAFKESQFGILIMVTWSITTVLLTFYIIKASYDQYLKLDFIASDAGYVIKKTTKIDIYGHISNSKYSMIIWNLVEKRMIFFIAILIGFLLVYEYMNSYFILTFFYASYLILYAVYALSVVKVQKNITREIIFSILPYSRKDVFKLKLISSIVVFAIMESMLIICLLFSTYFFNDSVDFYQFSAFFIGTFFVCLAGSCFFANKVMYTVGEEVLSIVMLIIILMIAIGFNFSIMNHMAIYIIGIASQLILAAYYLNMSMKRYVAKDIVG